MATYYLRCLNRSCRHRRTSGTHPDAYKRVPRCEKCGELAGWRVENRRENREICRCDGPVNDKGGHFPHRKTHQMCDGHPHGYYNQARRAGCSHEDVPEEFRPKEEGSDEDDQEG